MVAAGVGRKGMRRYYLMPIKLQFCKLKRVWEVEKQCECT
jgi:hypothetical protein